MSKVNEWQHLKIPFKEIDVATENFKTLIGRGGYGWVYKGKLLVSGKETMVAVKRLSEQYGQGLKEFLTEIQLLSGQHHPNLISLVGYCDEGKEKTIVYEYAERGSLDQYIRHSGKSTSTTLTWLQRLKICADVARGLDHLHSHVGRHQKIIHKDIKSSIIHRDIKSSNILIDENWVGKISDFGLSKLSVSGLGMSVIVSNGCGTHGYCEPEYYATGLVTKKSDVYSFGVVLFEVLCGRLCLIDRDDGFSLSSISAKEYYKNNSLDMIIDPTLKEHIGSYSMTKFAAIAYRCLHIDREQRPTMDVVVKELEEALRFLYPDVYKGDDSGIQFEQINEAYDGKDGLGEGVGVIDAEDVNWSINWKESEEKRATDLNKLKQIGDATYDEMHAGLASKGGSKLKVRSKLKTFVSYVDKLLTRGTSSSSDIMGSRNQRFTYREIQSITGNFNTIIAYGGFGKVFHGCIGDNQVAVKMYNELLVQDKEFQDQVRHLTSIHHKNIISLVGYCDEGKKKGVIYEFMANGNLGMHLFDGSPNVMSWKQRVEIGYDAAQGLEYMHHGCKPAIVHRDVKCSKILLNENFQAKLSGFKMCRAFIYEDDTHISTQVNGSLGYLDPEYFATGFLTKKSDVYSFGVVLLNLITGRPALSEQMQIVSWVKSIIGEGNVEKIIDPRLQGDFDINTAQKVVELAMACVQIESVERPTMNDIVMDLKICLRDLY